ncbi:2-phospho-L-lactate guanylyltransferase [Rhodoligotrophos appendicifer]|uniref:2-phospho-L-lactate guanylyltransferase n=1 Tax=Rhodoligotrophos appendicifer TaxID=987056 RepID=UPI0014783224|nr:2-phospho-L-lactate guanylyltransferase [Rhodoligotrophos appendicifer]
MVSNRTIWAVVAFKGFATAKQRLSPVFSSRFREALSRAMLEDVLTMLRGVPGLAGVMVATPDRAAADIAHGHGAAVIEDSPGQDYAGAVTEAAQHLATQNSDGLLCLPADVPAATAAEVTRLLAGHPEGPGYSIVPAHDRRGTNAILVTPPAGVPFSFGPDSFLRHLALARQAGLDPRIAILSGIGRDLDTAEDCHALLAMLPPGRTLDLLQQSRLDLGARAQRTAS